MKDKNIEEVLKEFDGLNAICNVCKTGIKSFIREKLEAQQAKHREELRGLIKETERDIGFGHDLSCPYGEPRFGSCNCGSLIKEEGYKDFQETINQAITKLLNK